MAETGFSGLEELDDFTKEMMKLANEELPKESKKFLKKNANQLKTATKNKAKDVGIQEMQGTGDLRYEYFNSFKAGKVYNYHGALSCRAYNSSPHAHFLEYGHLQTDKNGRSIGKGFVPGFHPFLRAYEEFMSKYYGNCESFVDDMISNHGL